MTIILINQKKEEKMTLRCKDGDLAVIVGEYPGCEDNIGRIVMVRGPAEVTEQSCGLLSWVIRPISRAKMVNLYIPGILISEHVTWQKGIRMPDCWLIPIRPPEDDADTMTIERLEIKRPLTLSE
jgi:hypothetical protein